MGFETLKTSEKMESLGLAQAEAVKILSAAHGFRTSLPSQLNRGQVGQELHKGECCQNFSQGLSSLSL